MSLSQPLPSQAPSQSNVSSLSGVFKSDYRHTSETFASSIKAGQSSSVIHAPRVGPPGVWHNYTAPGSSSLQKTVAPTPDTRDYPVRPQNSSPLVPVPRPPPPPTLYATANIQAYGGPQYAHPGSYAYAPYPSYLYPSHQQHSTTIPPLSRPPNFPNEPGSSSGSPRPNLDGTNSNPHPAMNPGQPYYYHPTS